MNIPIISFGNGEVTQKIDCRIDTQKYASSCRSLKNMLPLIYGCVERRPATKYVSSVFGFGNDYGAAANNAQTYGDTV